MCVKCARYSYTILWTLAIAARGYDLVFLGFGVLDLEWTEFDRSPELWSGLALSWPGPSESTATITT